MNIIRWQKLMQSFDIPSNEGTYHSLVRHYDEKHRHYHNQTHIDVVLQHLDDVGNLAINENEIEMALWFHDVIYKPFSSKNEIDSANLASTFLRKNDVSSEVVVRIHDLIMATLHTGQASGDDQELIIDIDLTILGAAEDMYNIFEMNVRKEYQLVPYFIYKKKRKEILSGFLARKRIFNNDYFYSKLEVQARLNLNSAIKSI